MTVWNPDTYLAFADERSRPFVDLLSRVNADPRVVIDLGCGPGNLTASLADRWPGAQVLGVDSSPEMIMRAAEFARPGLRFAVHDLRDWRPETAPDVIISNSTFQWVPEHRGMLAVLISLLRPDGWLAFQVPGNFDEPSHRLLRELSADPRYASMLADVTWPAAADAASYLDDLADLGCSVDAWETTYLHVLSGPNPVFRWIAGTGARPALQALPDDHRAQFVAEYQKLLDQAYPMRPYGTVLPFRRIFVVAQRGVRQAV
ncbi:MAG TPA: trans-aconitate 2-methyltransferase, partial [Propionibacteriaceae bacterium]|nr:trans-aconitate 2-methyltransferase [Propionibacteriaceae bacterium]